MTAGGVRSNEDLELVRNLGNDRVRSHCAVLFFIFAVQNNFSVSDYIRS